MERMSLLPVHAKCMVDLLIAFAVVYGNIEVKRKQTVKIVWKQSDAFMNFICENLSLDIHVHLHIDHTLLKCLLWLLWNYAFGWFMYLQDSYAHLQNAVLFNEFGALTLPFICVIIVFITTPSSGFWRLKMAFIIHIKLCLHKAATCWHLPSLASQVKLCKHCLLHCHMSITHNDCINC